jgi:predicted transcriptional regulator
MLLKNKVQETIADFPDKFSMNDLFMKLYVIDKIEKGMEEVLNGESITEDELDKEIEGWYK